MTKKLLKEFAKYIKNEVAYGHNRRMAADMVVEIAKKTSKTFEDKQELNFLYDCGVNDKFV